jgi:hypothetical protein
VHLDALCWRDRSARVERANNPVRTSAVPTAKLGVVLLPISAGQTQEAPPGGCKTGQVHFMKLTDISIDQVLSSAAAFPVPHQDRATTNAETPPAASPDGVHVRASVYAFSATARLGVIIERSINSALAHRARTRPISVQATSLCRVGRSFGMALCIPGTLPGQSITSTTRWLRGSTSTVRLFTTV